MSTPNVVPLPTLNDQQNGSSASAEESSVSLESQKEFSIARQKLDTLVKEWENLREKAKENRKTRDVECSVETLRREGKLDEDETLIPVRIIDTNITREQPPYINYLKNSRRLCIFNCISNPNIDSSPLELEFTRGMTYLGWETAHYKCIDGAATHGWDSVEVVFDITKPFNVGIEHVGFDYLYWPKTSRNIQQAPRVVRAYDYSILELKAFVDIHGWDAAQVNRIINARKAGKKEGETCRVHKVMFKEDGIVQVAWFMLGDGVDDWLKKPEPLYLGIEQDGQPVSVKEYPYFILPYRESEKPKLIDKHGRCFLDGNKQEAQTSILSAFVNGLNRATKILASPAQDDGTGNSVRSIENSPLDGGVVLNKPLNFYNAPYPDFQILKTLQYLDTANSQETNQTNFAVMNREDSRKTAKEMSLAEQQSNLLNSVQLTLFSAHIRGIYTLVWKIVQSQAMQGTIKMLLVNKPKPVINPLTGQPVVGQDGQPQTIPNWVNNVDVIGQEFDVRAAGDVDVIQRNELIQQMKQDWPVIQNTPLAQTFLTELVRLSYPQKGDQYAQVLQSGQQDALKQAQAHLADSGKLIAGLTSVLQGFVKQHPESVNSLPPDIKSRLGDLMKQGEDVMQQVGGQQKGAVKQ